MTKPITINLTLDELKTLDKFVELNDETRPLFDKIRSAYPESKVTFENHGDFDVVSYQDPKNSNSGDETYWRIIQPNSFSWWRRYTIPQRLDMVQNTEKEQELEKLYQEQLKREMIKRHLKPQGPVGPGPGPKGVIVGYEPTPQTPEQVADGLKEAFREAVKQGVVSSTTKAQNLYDIICDCMVKYNSTVYPGLICDILDAVEEWLPKEQSANSQNVDVEFLVEGFNDAIKKIKSKLR